MGTRANDSSQITFTERGEAALDELAAALTATVSQDSEAIAAVLGQVMRADVEDLAAAVTAADSQRAAEGPWVADGELAIGRDAHEVEWETVRAPMIHPGDLTPAGRVDDVEFHGGIRRVELTIDGVACSRGFDDRVGRVRPPPDLDPEVAAELDLGLTASPVTADEVAGRRLGRSEPTHTAAAVRSAPGR